MLTFLILCLPLALSILEYNYSIAVLHMRKAAGSQVLGFITDWMRINDCFPHPLLYVSTYGIQNGKSRQEPIDVDEELLSKLTALRPKCPYVNVIHEEYKSIDGKLLSTLINSNIKKYSNISFITTLRNPIERIGSQAFYGPGNIALTSFQLAIAKNSNISINGNDLRRALKSCRKVHQPEENTFSKDFCDHFLKVKIEIIKQLHTRDVQFIHVIDSIFNDSKAFNLDINKISYDINKEMKIFSRSNECKEVKEEKFHVGNKEFKFHATKKKKEILKFLTFMHFLFVSPPSR